MKLFDYVRAACIVVLFLAAYLQAGAPAANVASLLHNTIELYTSEWKTAIQDILQHATTIPCSRHAQCSPCIDASPEQLFYALLEASKQNLHSAIHYLVHCGAKVNGRIDHPHGHTPLMAAALCGKYATVKMLLDYGADINAQNPSGETALMKASGDTFCSSQEAATMVRLLLQHHADAALVDNQGNSVLYYALTKQSDDNCRIAQLLYEMNAADPTAKNMDGICLLEHPALLDKKNAIMWLIAHGAHVNNPKTLESTLLYTYATIVSSAYQVTPVRPLPLQTYIELIDEIAQRGGYLSSEKLAAMHSGVRARILQAYQARQQALKSNILNYKDVPFVACRVPVELYQLIGQFAGDHIDT